MGPYGIGNEFCLIYKFKLIKIMSRIILSTIVLFAFTLVGKSQTPYTLTAIDVTVENGIITSSTLSGASGDNYQPDIIIPEMLDGQVISGIGENAFQDNNLISVAFPAGLTSIESSAFRDNNLTSVTLPTGLTSIGSSAFRDNSLPNVDLPGGIISIGDFAFQNNRLTHVTLPTRLTTIEESAFNVNFLTSVDLPDELKSIETSAFRDNRLTSVDFPAGLKSIGQSAFLANRLTRVDLPGGITSIGEDAFSSNSGLTSFVLPKVSNVGNSVRWQASSGTVLEAEYVILPANFGNSYRAIILD